MGNRAVIKFGGADLSTGEKISKAAKMVAEAHYREIIVVVSAMGKTTDNLVATMSQISNLSDADYAENNIYGRKDKCAFFLFHSQGSRSKSRAF